jgi:hypothetical protein
MKNLFCTITFLAVSLLAQAQQPCHGTTGPCEWREGQPKIAQVQPAEEEPITPGAARQQLLLSLAIHDWKIGAHLPFMPDLNRPVYVKKGAWVCSTGGELINPHKDVLVHLGECLQSPKDVHIIGVMEPLGINEEEYVADHMTGTVQIIYRSKEMSDANVYTAWVFVKSLSN